MTLRRTSAPLVSAMRHLSLTAVATCLLLVSASGVEASLSDQLTHQITEAQRLELQKQINREIERLSQSKDRDREWATRLREALKQRAIMMEQARKFKQAEADLTQAVQVAPVDPAIYADRGYFYMRVGRYPDALGDFVSGTRLEPDNAIFSYGAGRVLANLQDYAAAVDLYNRALELDPTHARRFLSRAEAFVALGRYDEARPDYDRALKLGLNADERFIALVGRGRTLVELGKYGNAIEDFDEALRFDRNSARALMWRGVAQEKRGRVALALADYERASRRDPENGWLRQSIRRLRSR